MRNDSEASPASINAAAAQRVPLPEISASLPSELKMRISAVGVLRSRPFEKNLQPIGPDAQMPIANASREVSVPGLVNTGGTKSRFFDNQEIIADRLGFSKRNPHIQR